MANSRDFVRRDKLFAPRLSSRARPSLGRSQLARKLRHFNGAEPRLKSLVPALQAGAIDSLLQRVASQHAKNDGQPAVDLRELQPPRRFRADVIVVSRLATQNAPNRDERVVAAGS